MMLICDEIKEIMCKFWCLKQCELLWVFGIFFKIDDQGWLVVFCKVVLLCLEVVNQDDDEGMVKLDWLNG